LPIAVNGYFVVGGEQTPYFAECGKSLSVMHKKIKKICKNLLTTANFGATM
jgi:hypothetical protein